MKPTTLKLNREFRRVYGRGKSYVSPALVTYVLPSGRKTVRIGITTGKKIGCAVKRNRAKRIIFAAFMAVKDEITGGADIVFVARKRILLEKSTICESVIRKHLASAGLMG